MRRLTAALGVTALLAGGCFPGTDPGTETTERGRPQVEVEFPSTAPAESVQEAVVMVSNPGPGDIDPVVVSFSWVAGTPGEGLPRPIVDGGQEVVSVNPEPSSISADGVVFVFDELEEGGVMEIVFGIRVPLQVGPAANAVVVYDGRETGRARGVRLQTEVTR